MDTVVVCIDQELSNRVCRSLRQAECSVTELAPQELSKLLADGEIARPTVIFFASPIFRQDDLALLERFCGAKQDGAKVVAIGRAFSPNVILQTIRCGAADFLDVDNNFETELRGLLARLAVTHGERPSLGRLFTVFAPVGGVGASLLCVNLAAALAQKQQCCGLLDLQLRGGDLAMLLRTAPRHTLLSLADKAHNLDRAMFDQSLIKHECGIHLLASPEPFSNFREISQALIQRIVQFARASYPNVVVDLEDAEHAEQVRTLALSDQIIIPLRLDFVSLSHTKKCLDHLLKSHVSREHITLVATRVGQPKELAVERAVEVLELPIEHLIPESPACVNVSVNLGVPLVIADPTSKVSVGIVNLAKALLGAAPGDNAAARTGFPFKVAAQLFGLLSV